MSTHQIHVFISHSWTYSGHYDKLAKWIFFSDWSVDGVQLDFRDYSVPRDNPIHNAPSDRKLKEAINRHISPRSVVVIPTGMYTSHSKWIQAEIFASAAMEKPILGVDPWGQQRRASVVADAADEVVGWNSKSVVNGIWRLHRNG